jgi:hypothetical protein
MILNRLFFSAAFFFLVLSGFGQSSMTWCDKESGATIDTSCFRQPLKGMKNGTGIDVVSFKLAFTSEGTNYNFEGKTDRLTDEMIKKIMSVPENELVLFFNDVKGMASSGLSFHSFNGSYTLIKPEPVKNSKDTKSKGKK